MLRPFRRSVIWLATAGLVAGLATTSTASPDDPVAPTATEPGAPAPAEVEAVTLVTGDRAVLHTGVDGSRLTTLERDGLATTDYSTRQVGDDVYVIPHAAAPLLAEDRVDQELFNVTALLDQGYGDASRDTTPLIVTTDDKATNGKHAVPARDVPAQAEDIRPLPAADAVAFAAPKEDAATLWRELADTPNSKIWLDRQVTSNLDESVAAIGAPHAWDSGFDGSGVRVAVLDSGWDADHPDLAGQIVAEHNSTPFPGMDDFVGHGTHVASTIASTGAASDGLYQGVAPGVDLMIGRVLGLGGSGQLSWIIDGMQWAVANDADIVNMSLGTLSPACDDPVALAAEELARTSDTLFVVAAGNNGRRATVESPGCAASVLTVGAVDNAGATASFSSRGPVAGGVRSKPDLAAPGVGIVAAKNEGRADDAHTPMSGTSMATPHVAGAAALLLQQHPDWSPTRLKAALISASHPRTESRVQEQGAGMLDVERAVQQTILGPGHLDLATFDWPHAPGDRDTTEVAWTNTGPDDVRLDLELTVTGEDGERAPRDLAWLGSRRVTVPAGGTASVPITVDPSVRLPLGAYGSFSGRITARTDDQEVVTPVAFWVEPKSVDLTIRAIDRRGEPATFGSMVDVTGLDDATFRQVFPGGRAERTVRVRAGTYSVSALLLSGEPGTTGRQGEAHSVTFLGDPELVLDRDTVLTYDARTAQRFDVETDRPAEHQGLRVDYGRWWNQWLTVGGMTLSKYVDEVYAVRTDKAKTGGFQFSVTWRMHAPELAMWMADDGSEVPGEYMRLSPALDPEGRAQLVDAGTGSPDELAAADVSGKLALINSTGRWHALDALRAAESAGALGVVLAHDTPGRWLPNLGIPALPVVSVTPETEAKLRDRLAADTVELQWEGTPVAQSPYVYNLTHTSDKRVDNHRQLRFDDDKMAQVQTDWHSHGEDSRYYDMMYVQRDYMVDYGVGASMVGDVWPVDAPASRTEFYSTDDTLWWQASDGGPYGGRSVDKPRSHDRGTDTTSWYRQPSRATPGWNVAGTRAPLALRTANTITTAIPIWGDAEPAHYGNAGFLDLGLVELYRDGVRVGRGNNGPGIGEFTVSGEPVDYRLRLLARHSVLPGFEEPLRMSLGVETNWRFRSVRTPMEERTPLPLLLADYDLDLDLRNQAPADASHEISLSGAGQPGYDAGEVVQVRTWAAYGDESDPTAITGWVEAPVERTEHGWVATVDNRPGAGTYVSLKVDLVDEHGNGVEQVIARAYGVR